VPGPIGRLRVLLPDAQGFTRLRHNFLPGRSYNMNMQTSTGRALRRVALLVTLIGLLALVVQVGMAQDTVPAAVSAGTLTIGKSTTPAGGQDFWVTAASFQNAWGSKGRGNGQFRQPRDVATDAAGNFYISDHTNSRVQKLSPNGSYMATIGTRGRKNGQLLRPNAIVVSGNSLLITDTDNNRIAEFNTNGNFIRNWGRAGTGNGQFSHPQGIAVDSAGNVYVADTFNHRIQVFSAAGTYLRQWGTEGSGQGQFLFPAHIDFDASNNLYVADSNNSRIQVFDSQGTFLRQISGFGTAPGQVHIPVGLDVADGYVYVGDTFNNRVQKFTTAGAFVGMWSQAGGGTTISRPNGLLAIGATVYVSDIDANKIQIYSQASFQVDDGQQLSASLPAGTYTVTEAPKAGWTLNSATCTSGGTAIPGGVSVALADGATVVCTFANSQ
jgi:DNA-binding beta-propeller fold protein YncE